ncbi:MAG: rRNA maturation RNase YbeY [Acidimicrobiia bacterium]
MSAAPASRVFGVDEQDDEDIDVARWVRLAEDVLGAEGVRADSELSLLFVDEAAMADLNERHMGKAGPTDVLAFPIDDDAVDPGRWPDGGTAGPDRPPLDLDDLPTLLGDVVVCPAVAARQAGEHRGPLHGGTLDDEVALLVVHGILHVLGHDHAEPEETERMQAKERELLERFHRRS